MSHDELAAGLQAALGPAYAVERTLGEGGFAVVFRVLDHSLKRRLAVKVLSPDLITSYTLLERFKREAETVAQLSHPNIVPLHFIGEHDGMIYLAMACVDGGSVADRVARDGQLPVAEAERIFSEIANALAYAHRRGVVHRDIKPHNILLDADSGRALLTDFGIARSGESTLTATGMLVGTPAYLAPEQVTGEHSDHRADIYALGLTTYEMLTGKPAFEAASPVALLMKRLSDPPKPLRDMRPDVSRSLEGVVMRCLAADPADRYQSAAEIPIALAVKTGEEPTMLFDSREQVGASLASAKTKRRRRVGALVAAVVLPAIATGVWALASKRVVVPGATGSTSRVETDSSLVLIPAGSHAIGFDGDSSRAPRPSARPAHVVTLRAFQIARREVSIAEYRRFVSAEGVPMPPVVESDSTRPVSGVLWPEASRYCNWRYPSGGRLPSEEEWEAAARSAEGLRLDGMIRDYWDWTRSPVVAYAGGAALPDSMKEYRVIRGGAADTPVAMATEWYRGYAAPMTKREYLAATSFRCVRE